MNEQKSSGTSVSETINAVSGLVEKTLFMRI